jgi:hypothetical protein
MEVIYRDEALKDIVYWKKSGQKTVYNGTDHFLKALIMYSLNMIPDMIRIRPR